MFKNNYIVKYSNLCYKLFVYKEELRVIKAIFFDLDGTLLPMNEKEFTDIYFSLLYKKVSSLGYTKENLIDTIWNGTKLMYKNDGSKTNEKAFWDYFENINGKEKLKDKEIFDKAIATAGDAGYDFALGKPIQEIMQKFNGAVK